jgi:hypothetical protein
LNAAICSRHQAISPSDVISAPGRRTTNAFTSSPSRSSGTPMTAHNATAGWVISTSSISRGYTFAPPRRIMSFLRSTIDR